MSLDNFHLDPATLLVIVFGLVEFAKQLGARGNGLRLLSMALGVTLAVLYRLALAYPHAAPWIETAFFGLAAGLAASGVYSFVNQRLPVNALKARRRDPLLGAVPGDPLR